MYHKEILDHVEFLVIDNNPSSEQGKTTETYVKDCVPNGRYIALEELKGTAVRDYIFENADAPFVLCLDCHQLLESGSLQKLITYYDENPETEDFIQGPMISESLDTIFTHFKPTWGGGMYGQWGIDERASDIENPPFDIPMQGLGLFSCKKSAWLGFNRLFRGFGGEEGYIHEKFRQQGRRTLCVPFLKWMHRFYRPGGPKYSVTYEDRVINYILGRLELELDYTDVTEYFTELVGKSDTDKWTTKAIEIFNTQTA